MDNEKKNDDNMTIVEENEINDTESVASPLKQDNAKIKNELLQKRFVQRGRLDIHVHKTVSNHLKQGAEALNKRDYKKAVQEFLQVIQYNNDSAEAHFHLGLAYFMLNEYDKAIDSYKMAITCEPTEITSYTNLADIYRLLKRYDDAVSVYIQATKIQSDNPELFSELGALYTLQGKRREAISAFKSAMLIKFKNTRPDTPDESRNYEEE
ncbi:tetratricopeptide repeat protein [Candidatus Poribacteria bacterium]|nr:tetratricopeptide repeat protein [Candidatus Poribacteria bacterium]